ncbi:MAG: hypothetical protein WCW26_03390 [Candidatus Buchananbacteria bacterium]
MAHGIVFPLDLCTSSCNGCRGTIYCIGGKAVACSPADGETIGPRIKFPNHLDVELNQLPCWQCQPGEKAVRISFASGGSKTYRQADLSVHVQGLMLGSHSSVTINTMLLQRQPACLHCQGEVDLTGGKMPVTAGKKGLLCDTDCEAAFLAANPNWQKLVEKWRHPLCATA